jgi:calcineurin-like phosphoesterase family protein
MDNALIINWNKVVRPNDEVYILGDFTMRPAEKAHEYLTRMKGRKYFIRGNHDRFLKNNRFAPYEGDFVWIKDYYVLKHQKKQFVLFHFPIAEWHQFFRGAIHLYGHVHNAQKSLQRLEFLNESPAFNVSVDVNGYFPVSIEEIMERALRLAGNGGTVDNAEDGEGIDG